MHMLLLLEDWEKLNTYICNNNQPYLTTSIKMWINSRIFVTGYLSRFSRASQHHLGPTKDFPVSQVRALTKCPSSILNSASISTLPSVSHPTW